MCGARKKWFSTSEGHQKTGADCFKRIAGGERLVGYEVTRIVERSSVGECEEECDVYRCTHFSFGNATDGNGTCELTTDREISRTHDPGFDLYQKTTECAEGKPTGYEKACYRRIITGKRLHERFIRHSLPCNSLQACQHQCSIEKHFKCEGFNIRLDSARIGRGICELSSVDAAHVDTSRDFVFAPEFAYYERDHDNGLPNCGAFAPSPEGAAIGHRPPGGPYFGGDSYGPWGSGRGTVDHGPWGSHGYGSGFFQPNDPSRGPPPPFNAPDSHWGPYSGFTRGYGYGYGYGSQSFGFPTPFYPAPTLPEGRYGGGLPAGGSPATSFRPNFPFHPGPDALGTGSPGTGYRPRPPDGPGAPTSWGSNYPSEDRRSDKPTVSPTYIIIDAGTGLGGTGSEYPVRTPSAGYLPARPRPPPPPPPPPPPRPPKTFPGPHKPFGIAPASEVCFRREHPGHRLNPGSIKGMYDTPTLLDCEALCTDSPFKCTGYSFRYASADSGPNCLLTDYAALDPQTHLLPDRSCDVYFRMGTCTEIDRSADTECFLKVGSSRKLHPSRIVMALSARGMSECELSCLSSVRFTCRSFSYRYGPPVIGEPLENCFLSDWPTSALTHLDLVPADDSEVYERGSFGHGCELDVGPPHMGPGPPFGPYPSIPRIGFGKGSWSAGDTWRRFTVSGWPCRSGTECELNPLGGFWACEVEGGDHAQWDYCCRPKHSCGFSRGHRYPWCYVGEAGPDQWRPCSEFYYPEFGNRYWYKPVQSHSPHPLHPLGPLRDTTPPWTSGSDGFGPPSSWPISYVHAEPPPNETHIWNPDDNLFYHRYQDGDSARQQESPRIRFKPCRHGHPYPRAVVQKLDLNHTHKAANPEEQSRRDRKPTPPPPPPPVAADTREKKSSPHVSASPPPPHDSPNKTKAVVETVEKIIMESGAGAGAGAEGNESLREVETKYPEVLS